MADYVIIVAGGKGLRMGSDVPKQFLPVGGRPVLMRTIDRFREYSAALQVILVLPRAQQDYWRQLCREYDFPLPVTPTLPQQGGAGGGASLPQQGGAGGESYLLADGGATRFHSVQNGLALIPDDAEGVVGVHDGVRPFPCIDVISRCYETARQTGAAIPVTPVVETLRQIAPTPYQQPTPYRQPTPSPSQREGSLDTSTRQPTPYPSQREGSLDTSTRDYQQLSNQYSGTSLQQSNQAPLPLGGAGGGFQAGGGLSGGGLSGGGFQAGSSSSFTVPRSEYRLVQTPQTFDIQLLKTANRQPYNEGFTDDASVVETYGHAITLVEGNRENIKLTTPYDLKIAEALID